MSETRVTTGKVRFSFVNVFEPSGMGDEAEKYSLMLLLPKSDTKTVTLVENAIKAAYTNGQEKFGGKLPPVWKNPLRDGDAEKADQEEFKGMYFFNAKSNDRPGIVDKDVQEIIDRNEVYSGCYGRVNVNFYAYNFNGSKGVACGLNHVQKLTDGEPLGGGKISAAEAFGDLADDPMFQ